MKTKELFDIPILFIVHNSNETTWKVFEQIRHMQPADLYITANGPLLVSAKETRRKTNILGSIDWRVSYRTRFHAYLSSNQFITDSISWFFEYEEKGIILEDNFLPHENFFEFCSVMLIYHKYNRSIGHISGVNPGNYWTTEKNGYHIFKYPLTVGGWATWKRSWNLYQTKNIKSITEINPAIFCNVIEKEYWLTVFKHFETQGYPNWYYEWLLTLWGNNMKSVSPHQNLIKIDSGIHKWNYPFSPGKNWNKSQTFKLDSDSPYSHDKVKNNEFKLFRILFFSSGWDYVKKVINLKLRKIV